MVARMLEVTQWWGEEVLDVRTWLDEAPRVSVGLRSGARWRFLGVDMGYVPVAAAPFLRALGPGWSDVERERRADFAVPDPTDDGDWDLVRPDPAGIVLRVPPGWSCDGATRPCDEDGVAEVVVGDEPVTVERAPFRFAVRLAPRPERVESRFSVDPGLLGAAGTMLLVLGTVALGTTLAPAASAVATNAAPEDLLEVMLSMPPPPAPAAAKGGNEGKKAKKEEGAAPKAKRDTRGGGRRDDAEVAKGAGILGADLDVLGTSDLSAELRAGVGGLIGATGSAVGGDGLGSRGPGLGGGGVAEGIGGLGPRGRGPGGPGLYDGGPGKLPGEIETPDGGVRWVGQLDRSQIDEVIKRHLSAVRYCYQRELQKAPGLQGKVTVRFTIAGDGTVSSASASGSLESEAVRSCVSRRFMSMQFPEPRGHGLVVVSYPFLFSPG